MISLRSDFETGGAGRVGLRVTPEQTVAAKIRRSLGLGEEGEHITSKTLWCLDGQSAQGRCCSGILGREWGQDIEIWEPGPL